MADNKGSPLQTLRSRDRSDTNDKSASPLGHRPLGRSSTFAESSPLNPDRRRNSILSDHSLDDARQSLRSSTDDLLLPKLTTPHHEAGEESNNWHSIPLAFALVPAISGMIFQNGSAVVTDITLLALAAIFLNWSVRLPWDWYTSARSIRLQDTQRTEMLAALDESNGEYEPASDATEPLPQDEGPTSTAEEQSTREAASAELRVHEILALMSCFSGPLCGAYLLHTLRTQLSRPSEGLVSNYNLTIFLLAAEVRPLSHLVKMVQARTLYLQRTLAINPHSQSTSPQLAELSKRIELLESKPLPFSETPSSLTSEAVVKSTVTEARRLMQPDLDALNRAVRRYEKRAQIQTMQTEARLLDLEQRIADSLALAASAAQGQRHQRGLLAKLFDAIMRTLLLPIQALWGIVNLPVKILSRYLGSRVKRGKSDRDRKGVKGNHGRIAQGSRMAKRG